MAEYRNSFGLIVDLMECLLQRCLSFNTMDCRVAYEYVKAWLADPTVSKVVLIGHSQGGIIASMVLDKLFGDLPTDSISKLVHSDPGMIREVSELIHLCCRRSTPSALPPRTSITPCVLFAHEAPLLQTGPVLKSPTVAFPISSITVTSET